MDMGTELVLIRIIDALRRVINEDSKEGREDDSRTCQELVQLLKYYIYNIPVYTRHLEEIQNIEKEYNKDFKIIWHEIIVLKNIILILK